MKGPLCYKDIRTFKNIVYPTFKDGYEASGFLADDNEYIKAIKEAKDWVFGHFLRKILLKMLFSDSLNSPHQVWEQTCDWLSNGILYRERKTTGNLGTKLFL